MSKTIRLKRGFDIKLAGRPEKKIIEINQPETYALKPTDFRGLNRPKLLVKEGDAVKAGTPVFYDKAAESVRYCAPVSGEVVEIRRGDKRKLLEVKILADKQLEYERFKKYSVSEINNLSREEATDQLKAGGVWPQIIQRPYGIIASSEDTPKAIFISAFDSHPLAPDMSFALQGMEQYFQVGLDILKKFTSGQVNLNIDATAEVAQIFAQAKGVRLNKFSGPHPAGNVGVQIHHLSPMNKGEIAWTISPYGVVQIGKLFLEGIYDTSRVIGLTGSEVKEPCYVRTYSGAHLRKLLEGKTNNEQCRYISGNVLTGEGVGLDGYLGYYHHQITVIPEGNYEEAFGWILPSTRKLSFHRAFGLLGYLNPGREYELDTNTHGEPRAFVVTGAFEKVLPMDIYPTYLFKAIMAEDFDDMEALGIYEVIEEDVALCEFIDVSKHDLQQTLRTGLDLLKNG